MDYLDLCEAAIGRCRGVEGLALYLRIDQLLSLYAWAEGYLQRLSQSGEHRLLEIDHLRLRWEDIGSFLSELDRDHISKPSPSRLKQPSA